MLIFVSITNLNSSSHSNSLHKICIYTRQSIVQPSFTKKKKSAFSKGINSEWLLNSYINLSQLHLNHSANIKCKQLKYFCEEQHHFKWLFSNCSIYFKIFFKKNVLKPGASVLWTTEYLWLKSEPLLRFLLHWSHGEMKKININLYSTTSPSFGWHILLNALATEILRFSYGFYSNQLLLVEKEQLTFCPTAFVSFPLLPKNTCLRRQN